MWCSEHGTKSRNVGSNLRPPLTVWPWTDPFPSLGEMTRVQLIMKRFCLALTLIDNVLCLSEFSFGRPNTVVICLINRPSVSTFVWWLKKEKYPAPGWTARRFPTWDGNAWYPNFPFSAIFPDNCSEKPEASKRKGGWEHYLVWTNRGLSPNEALRAGFAEGGCESCYSSGKHLWFGVC